MVSSNYTFLPLASHSFLFFTSLLHWSKTVLQGIPRGTVIRTLSFQKKKKRKKKNIVTFKKNCIISLLYQT